MHCLAFSVLYPFFAETYFPALPMETEASHEMNQVIFEKELVALVSVLIRREGGWGV